MKDSQRRSLPVLSTVHYVNSELNTATTNTDNDEIIDITPRDRSKRNDDDDCFIIKTVKRPCQCMRTVSSDRGEWINHQNQGTDSISNQSNQSVVIQNIETQPSTSNQVNTRSRASRSGSIETTLEPPSKRLKVGSEVSSKSSIGEKIDKTKSKPSYPMPKCPICFESLEEMKENGKQLMATQCGHILCSFCLGEHQKSFTTKSFNCPTCRTKLTKTKVHNLFL